MWLIYVVSQKFAQIGAREQFNGVELRFCCGNPWVHPHNKAGAEQNRTDALHKHASEQNCGNSSLGVQKPRLSLERPRASFKTFENEKETKVENATKAFVYDMSHLRPDAEASHVPSGRKGEQVESVHARRLHTGKVAEGAVDTLR